MVEPALAERQRPRSDAPVPIPQPADAVEPLDEVEEGGARFLFFQVMPGWLVSFTIHLVLIVLLALIPLLVQNKDTKVSFFSGQAVDDVADGDDTISTEEFDFGDPLAPKLDVEVPVPDALQHEFSMAPATESLDTSGFALGDIGAPAGAAMADVSDLAGGKFSNRFGSNRAKAGDRMGASGASEASVKLALEWIAKHQLPDGSWNFNHMLGPGDHRTSGNPGRYDDAVFGATAMALLPFLGVGQTHLDGEYKETIRRGIEFLVKNGEQRNNTLSFFEPQGQMYSHGLATIVLTEAYGMSQDPDLAEPAQQAINFIAYAQDPVGGGWRYVPQQPGDTSVVGWQIMALKSAHMAGLHVDDRTIRGATKFLDSVAGESGSLYGYMRPITLDQRWDYKATSAIGLLCRMYLGWDRGHPGIGRGTEWFESMGPSDGRRVDMYYNYYATQVMFHYGDQRWIAWNERMREFLVSQQDKSEGAERGSWFFPDGDLGAAAGGRLYCTAMAAMTLEVYYRYMPIYDTQKTEEADFPLD
jgi:hypothetical protein